MARVHLFEFTDQTWYPSLFRAIQTDYLQFVASLGSSHRYLLPLIRKCMEQTGTSEVVDLCSGGSGPWPGLVRQAQTEGNPIHVNLTDLYPNPGAVERWADGLHPGIRYLAEPVDAHRVPAHLKGVRTLFEGFHHFRPEDARAILQGAADQRAAIAIFDIALTPPWGPLMLILSPVMTLFSYLVLTPFIQPQTLTRLVFTYLLPVVPLATCWDGIVSLLRGYSIPELQTLTAPLQREGYTWECGRAETGTPIFTYTYLLGYPS
jgi:hypothetical protein